MALNTRQSDLLVQQDWTRVYQTFRDADFQSYDYETIRKSMIDYLRTYYPEDFNDFTESSEYIALIDLIAFLGQSLAFRTDLNARENFIDTAERRDSVLKLARLISYNPTRNIAASGLLKVNSISTSESITDGNGMNLANLIISWDDPTNENWLEQFTAVMNAALVDSQVIGKSGGSNTISGISVDEYSINAIPGATPVFKFSAQIENTSTPFEAVSATTAGQSYVYEVNPSPSGKFNILYRNDNQGNGSINTGFFTYFKQGALNTLDFAISDSLPNRVVSVNYANINNSDVWLYSLDSAGNLAQLWTAVPAVGGINIIYNQSTDRNLYQINTKTDDQIELVFGDGSFSNIPQGNFRLIFRQSNGLSYKITPDEMQNIVITVNYVSRSNRSETLSINTSLRYTVANSAASESLDDIRTKAPQQYYTQNRMITGEDYNILPYTTFSNVIKVKAVNRTSSGISRYLDVVDSSGKYSSTNIFAQDGALYRSIENTSSAFTFSTSADIVKVLYNTAKPMIKSKELMHLYYYSAPVYSPSVGILTFNQTLVSSGSSSGYFTDTAGNVQTIGSSASGNLQYLQAGALVKITPPAGTHFNKDNQIVAGASGLTTDKDLIYATVQTTSSNIASLSQIVPTGAVVTAITPVLLNDWSADFVTALVNLISAKKDFGVRYDAASMSWKIVNSSNLAAGFPNDSFSLTNAGSADDSSWLLAFTYFSGQYTITQRNLYYYFESQLETRFYFDPKVKVYDSSTGTTVRDHIKILRSNSGPDSSRALASDQIWYVYGNVVQLDGYLDTRKILVTFPDSNNDGIPDDPTLFDVAVNPDYLPDTKYVFFKQVQDYDNFISSEIVPAGAINTSYQTYSQISLYSGSYAAGQVFYATNENNFYTLTSTGLIQSTSYFSRTGRQDLYFQYRHNSPGNRRVDPSPNNIMDLYILTAAYNSAYSAWIKDTSGTVSEPVPPTTDELRTEFESLESLKALSDTIIYNPAKFKPIFGKDAVKSLQAIFKVVKNPNVAISDNDVKSRVIAAINNYFDINNWDFGETFYFSELSAYLHAQLLPNIASIIIVPATEGTAFGGLYQINAEANEIVVSCATVDNVEIISAITASQINQSLAGLNTL
jgi:hypothetical protein